MLQLASSIVNLIASMGYTGLFWLIAGESALLPIPSEIVLPFAGYLAYLGKLNFWAVVVATTIGQLFGSMVAYAIGKYGGRPFVLNYGKYFFLNHKHFEHSERWFNQHGEFVIFFSRLLPVVRTVISLPAGIARMNFSKFVLYSLLGIIPWTLFLVYIGFRLGAGWQSIIGAFDKFQYVVIAGIVIFIVWWIWKGLREKQMSKNETNTQ